MLALKILQCHKNASHESIEETVLVLHLDDEDNVATIEGNYSQCPVLYSY